MRTFDIYRNGEWKGSTVKSSRQEAQEEARKLANFNGYKVSEMRVRVRRGVLSGSH